MPQGPRDAEISFEHVISRRCAGEMQTIQYACRQSGTNETMYGAREVRHQFKTQSPHLHIVCGIWRPRPVCNLHSVHFVCSVGIAIALLQTNMQGFRMCLQYILRFLAMFQSPLIHGVKLEAFQYPSSVFE